MFNIHNCVCDYPRNIAECPAVCPGIYRYKLRAQAVTVANIDIFENCFAETKVYILHLLQFTVYICYQCEDGFSKFGQRN